MILRALAPFVVVSLFASLAAGQVALRMQRPLELRLAEGDVLPQAELDDRDMQGDSVVKGPNGHPAVQVRLRPSGVKKFNAMAKANQLKTVAIIYRGRIISTPVIDGELVDDLLDIVGWFSDDEATSLAKALAGR